MKCTLCTCPNCMAGYEREAYRESELNKAREKAWEEYTRLMNEIAVTTDTMIAEHNAQYEVKAPEFEVVTPTNYGGKTFFVFGAGILALIYFIMNSPELFAWFS